MLLELQRSDEIRWRIQNILRAPTTVYAQQQRDQSGYNRRVTGGSKRQPAVILLSNEPDLRLASLDFVIVNEFRVGQYRQPPPKISAYNARPSMTSASSP